LQVPSWFFVLSGVILIASGVVRILLNPPRKRAPRKLGPKPADADAAVPVSRFPWQVGLVWSLAYVVAGVAIILYAAGVLGPRR
jgi:hypothetical protein